MAVGHRWKPGEVTNPRGRPPVGRSLAYAIRNRFPPERIVDIAEDLIASEDERVRMVALQFLVDRGFGKVPDAPANDDDADDVIEVGHIPLEERRAALTSIAKVAAMSALTASVSNDDSEH
jgi:hypothetical protein